MRLSADQKIGLSAVIVALIVGIPAWLALPQVQRLLQQQPVGKQIAAESPTPVSPQATARCHRPD
jgi:hypothetical protein